MSFSYIFQGKSFYLLDEGGYVIGSVGLSICVFVSNITQKVMNELQ